MCSGKQHAPSATGCCRSGGCGVAAGSSGGGGRLSVHPAVSGGSSSGCGTACIPKRMRHQHNRRSISAMCPRSQLQTKSPAKWRASSTLQCEYTVRTLSMSSIQVCQHYQVCSAHQTAGCLMGCRRQRQQQQQPRQRNRHSKRLLQRQRRHCRSLQQCNHDDADA